MRVHEFSKKINIPNKELLNVLQQGGFDIKSHMSVLNDKALAFLEKKYNAKKEVKPILEKLEKTAATKAPVVKPQEKKVVAPVQKLPPVKEVRPAVPEPAKPLAEIVVKAMSVGEFADKVAKPVNEVILTLLKSGVMATKNQIINEAVVERLARIYEIQPIHAEQRKEEFEKKAVVTEGDLQERYPIVVVMGHVDHGKTTLLDFIRKTRVASREKGGITQHIGAYEALTPQGAVVFLDTPGHEAFSKIRQRGAKVADIAVLVVAADDGIMPQTIEAIKHAKNMELPIIVAINKIDKADPGRLDVVKRQLAEQDLLPEDWGGEIVCVPISALTGKGVDQLLEMILLQSQLMELRALKTGQAKGFVLESKLEKGRGAVATVICQHGTVKIGDYFTCGFTAGRVSSLINSAGKHCEQAGPSIPVQIAGFESLPEAGDFFQTVPKAEYLKARSSADERKTETSRLVREGAINLLVKTDSNSSKEALVDAIERLSRKLKIGFNIISASVGAINESDIELAYNTGSEIIGLHIKPEAKAALLAAERKVPLTLHDIIYKLLESLEVRAERDKVVEMVNVKLGEAEVRKVFDIKGAGVIAGSYIKDGRFSHDGFAVLWRGNRKIGEGKITSLQRDRKPVKEVHAGFECGFVIEGMTDVQVDDRVECFIKQPKS